MVYLSWAIFMANFQLLTALVISKPGGAWGELVWGYSYGIYDHITSGMAHNMHMHASTTL